MAEAVEAEQRRARAASPTIVPVRPQSVSPAASLIIDKLAAIERHVGIQPTNGNFQAAERRIYANGAERQGGEHEPRWAGHVKVTHALISAVDVRLDAVEDRLQNVLKDAAPAHPTPAMDEAPAGASLGSSSLIQVPVTKMQAAHSEIVARLQVTLNRLDALLTRIDL